MSPRQFESHLCAQDRKVIRWRRHTIGAGIRSVDPNCLSTNWLKIGGISDGKWG